MTVPARGGDETAGTADKQSPKDTENRNATANLRCRVLYGERCRRGSKRADREVGIILPLLERHNLEFILFGFGDDHRHALPRMVSEESVPER